MVFEYPLYKGDSGNKKPQHPALLATFCSPPFCSAEAFSDNKTKETAHPSAKRTTEENHSTRFNHVIGEKSGELKGLKERNYWGLNDFESLHAMKTLALKIWHKMFFSGQSIQQKKKNIYIYISTDGWLTQ